MCKPTNYHYEARIRNQRECYIDKELRIQYVNELEGIREQTIPEHDKHLLNSLKDNALLKVNPELYYEWDFEKNSELNIYDMTKGMEKKAWWICDKCGSSYISAIDKRKSGRKCSYCKGSNINHTNSLASSNPELAFQFDIALNSTTPYDIPPSSNKKYWWKCCNNHSWETSPNGREYNNRGCPYCTNQAVLIGYNDMWTTNPKQASWLLNPEDGFKYVEGSGQKVDWKCECGEVHIGKPIKDVRKNGLRCASCSDGYSYPEKFVLHLLKQLKLEFKFQKKFEWSQGKIYDFYIPSLDMIIETHGSQHYIKHGFSSLGGRTLEEEQLNDAYKYNLAIENEIQSYITLDCTESDLDFIKNSVLKSEMNDIFNLNDIDWVHIDVSSKSSFHLKIVEMWNTGKYQTATDIAEEIGISVTSVAKHLNRGTKSNLCNYDGKLTYEIRAKKARKAVIQMDINGGFINEFSHVGEVLESNIAGITGRTSIKDCCLGNRKNYGNFKWMYKEDYEKYIEEQSQAV